MQIFTLFEARMRALHSGRHTPADLTLGFQSRVLAASAGLGDTCDYVILCAGETQDAFVADRNEWWGCLRGGLRLSAPGHDCLLMGGGELFAPARGMPMQVRAMADTILVRAVPQQQDDAAPVVSLPEGRGAARSAASPRSGRKKRGASPARALGGGVWRAAGVHPARPVRGRLVPALAGARPALGAVLPRRDRPALA